MYNSIAITVPIVNSHSLRVIEVLWPKYHAWSCKARLDIALSCKNIVI